MEWHFYLRHQGRERKRKRGELLRICGLHVYRWLVKKKKIEKARKVLRSLRRGVEMSEIEEELTDIQFTVSNTQTFSIKEILKLLLKWQVLQRYVLNNIDINLIGCL